MVDVELLDMAVGHVLHRGLHRSTLRARAILGQVIADRSDGWRQHTGGGAARAATGAAVGTRGADHGAGPRRVDGALPEAVEARLLWPLRRPRVLVRLGGLEARDALKFEEVDLLDREDLSGRGQG